MALVKRNLVQIATILQVHDMECEVVFTSVFIKCRILGFVFVEQDCLGAFLTG